MARDALLTHFKQNRVAVAIQPNFLHKLLVTTLFALTLEAVSAATEVNGLPGRQGLPIALCAHPGQHQYLIRFRVLGNCGHKAGTTLEIGRLRLRIVHRSYFVVLRLDGSEVGAWR